MNSRIYFLSACLALASLTAWLPAGAQSGAGAPPPTADSTRNAPLPQILKLPGSPTVGTVRTGASRYTLGHSVHIAFVVDNPTSKTVNYNFPTAQQCDFTVTNPQGKTVWQWSKGHVFSPMISRISLAPGIRKLFTIVWNGRGASGRPVAPGVYTITATLTSNNRPAITGGVIVNTERDPTNIGIPTQAPADTGAIRQVNVAPPVTASTTVIISSR